LLNALIICNDLPVFHNQRRLTELILQDRKLKDKILVTLELKSSDKIILTFKNEMEYEYLSIENLKNISRKRDDCKIFKYVVNLIKFIGNLCLGNNLLAVEGFRQIYSLNICIKIITNSLLPSELRAAFAHLVHHMWFKSGESSEHRKSKFFSKVWDELESDTEVQTEPDPARKELWLYISGFLNDTKKMWELRMFEKTDFEYLKSIFQLTADLLLENILSKVDIVSLTSILQEMLLCNFQDEIGTRTVDEKKLSELVACKAILIDTFKIIQMFEFNQFILILLTKVKQFYSIGDPAPRNRDLNDGDDQDSSRQPALGNLDKNLLESGPGLKTNQIVKKNTLRNALMRIGQKG
jgi:hypothetical protein